MPLSNENKKRLKEFFLSKPGKGTVTLLDPKEIDGLALRISGIGNRASQPFTLSENQAVVRVTSSTGSVLFFLRTIPETYWKLFLANEIISPNVIDNQRLVSLNPSAYKQSAKRKREEEKVEVVTKASTNKDKKGKEEISTTDSEFDKELLEWYEKNKDMIDPNPVEEKLYVKPFTHSFAHFQPPPEISPFLEKNEFYTLTNEVKDGNEIVMTNGNGVEKFDALKKYTFVYTFQFNENFNIEAFWLKLPKELKKDFKVKYLLESKKVMFSCTGVESDITYYFEQIQKAIDNELKQNKQMVL